MCASEYPSYLLSRQEIAGGILVIFADVDETSAFKLADAYSSAVFATGKLYQGDP